MTDILVIGSLNADLVVRALHFPAPGETIQGEDLATIPGGKGANQAVAAAKQGARVAIAGRVGRDGFGSTLIENLNDFGVDTTHICRDEQAATGTAMIVVDSNGQNSIVVSPGANGRVTCEDVDAAVPAMENAKILLLQFEIPLETVTCAASLARKKGLRVILNPAPARPVPPELLANVDLLIPNETELSRLSETQVNDIESVEKAARSLLARGVQTVIVTLGEKGALVVQKSRVAHIPAFKVKVVDTTAAGDAFIGGLAAALLRGLELEEAVRCGNAAGALAVTRFGAQTSLPTLDEVQALLKKP